MTEPMPSDHPLRQLFRSAVDRAFREFRDLYSPDVAAHIGDNLLPDFLHVDRIFRLRNRDGERLEELADMVHAAHEKEGPERRIEVDRYIGDFVLFMGGFFPQSLRRHPWFAKDAMVARVGGLFVKFTQPIDYYVAEGRNAYERAAATARIFEPESHHTFRQLGKKIEGYLELVGAVRRLIQDDPEVREVDELVDTP